MRCLIDAWNTHESELRRFLCDRARDEAEGEDLLQEIFLRAIRRGNGLCGLDNPRAWLFRAGRNLLIDRQRLSRDQVPLPDDIAAEPELDSPPVDGLTQCLPQVMARLGPEDRDAIERCDIEGMSQRDYAASRGISLPGAKSRIQRARRRLKAQLTETCQVRFDESGEVCCFVPCAPGR